MCQTFPSYLYTSQDFFTSVQGGKFASYAQAVDNFVENPMPFTQICAQF